MNKIKELHKKLIAKANIVISAITHRSTESAAPYEFKTFAFGSGTGSSQSIPKIIWSYWTGGQPPDFVQHCYNNWKAYNPEFEIIQVNDNNLISYLDDIPSNLQKNPPEKRADWVRVALLEKFGGFWLDSSILLSQSLDFILQEQFASQAGFVGFYIEKFTISPHQPVVENWFMACPPHSPFIHALKRLFTQEVIQKDAAQYINRLHQLGIFSQVKQGIDNLNYLTMHGCIQEILTSSHADYKLQLAKAEDGPFLYHVRSQWKRRKLQNQIFFQPVHGSITPIIKFRGNDRGYYDIYTKNKIYQKESIFSKIIKFNENA